MSISPARLEYQHAHAYENKTPAFLASVSVVVTLATIGVALRLLARRLTTAKLGADDYVIILALVRSRAFTSGNSD